MKVVIVKPDNKPEIKEVENDLKSLQKIVGGIIQCVPLTNNLVLTCNDEGKLIGLPINRHFGNDILVGTFFITKSDNEGDFISLTDEDLTFIRTRILKDLPLDD